MEGLSYRDINDIVLEGMRAPSRLYYLFLTLSFLGICLGVACWGYQVHIGLQASGMNHPVMWGTYLINFVFWIEIGHAGSLMSALLYLCRAKWRSPIARTAEAMTIFAVAMAGFMPFVHLGRSWLWYWLVPYPSERTLWPNFQSPLIFDFWAASGYLTLSLLFWYTGLYPDLAVARDHFSGFRRKLYRVLSLGWRSTAGQWRPFHASYTLFAGLTVAFVPCVASIVSWDFALTIVPGYHSTIWGPYFLVGALHSGLAMLLTLIIPLRRIYGLERIITVDVLENIAKILIATTFLMFYDYLVEFFMAWYGGDPTEQTTFTLRVLGPYSPIFWAMVVMVIVAPLLFSFKKVRTDPVFLFVISIVINVGMWLERFIIIIGPPAHDWIPYNWKLYWPSLTEWGILTGSISFFFFLFLVYSKLAPTVSITETKVDLPAPGAPGQESV